MTKKDIFDRLVEIAGHTNGGARGGTFLTCDLMHQDALYELQDKTAQLLSDIANDIGEGLALAKRFPNAFHGEMKKETR